MWGVLGFFGKRGAPESAGPLRPLPGGCDGLCLSRISQQCPDANYLDIVFLKYVYSPLLGHMSKSYTSYIRSKQKKKQLAFKNIKFKEISPGPCGSVG